MKKLFILIAVFCGMHGAVNAQVFQVTTKYECPGTLDKSGKAFKAILYLELSLYRSVVSLWSKSEGNLKTEEHYFLYDQSKAEVSHTYYPDLKVIGNIVRIEEGSKTVGDFSRLSGQITLQTGHGIFSGKCLEKK